MLAITPDPIASSLFYLYVHGNRSSEPIRILGLRYGIVPASIEKEGTGEAETSIPLPAPESEPEPEPAPAKRKGGRPRTNPA
jgi:hypothetical protein